MKLEYDRAKDAANRLKHGVGLDLGGQVIEIAAHTLIDARMDYGEDRFVAFGYVEDRLYVCVFTMRSDATRIISVRKANEREVTQYG